MSSMLPSDQNNQKKPKPEPFGELFKSMHEFIHEKPIKGFLQSIDEFFKNPFPPSTTFPVNTAETRNEYIITAELPGIKKEQIHLNISGNHLTISIDNNEVVVNEDDQNHIYQQRVMRQQLSRTISLPQPINEKRINASYRDGLLKIRIPHVKGKIIEIND